MSPLARSSLEDERPRPPWGGALRAGALLALLALPAGSQEWYIPKRPVLLKGGSLEAGFRTQLNANNDGLLDSLTLQGIPSIRYAPLRRLEFYAELPLAYAEREDVVGFVLVKNDTTGIGDAFAQASLEGFSGEDWKVLFSADGSFPTGKHQYRHRVPTGSGHFAAALGSTAMKVLDPVVLFTYLGFQHTFPREFAPGRVSPGKDIRFRFGGALALNPRVQTTLHVTGNIVSPTRVNGAPQAGSSGTLMRFGWGLDWTMSSRLRLGLDAAIGMTKNTPDATVSIGTTCRLF